MREAPLPAFRLMPAALALAMSPLLFLHPVRISGRSMEPCLRDGALRLVLRPWCAGRPAPGEVWMLRTPTGSAVKRLVALPGSRVELRDGRLSQGDRMLPEPYPVRRDPGSSGSWDTGNGYFMLGDNRPESHDSRAWGSIPRERLEGRIWPD